MVLSVWWTVALARLTMLPGVLSTLPELFELNDIHPVQLGAGAETSNTGDLKLINKKRNKKGKRNTPEYQSVTQGCLDRVLGLRLQGFELPGLESGTVRDQSSGARREPRASCVLACPEVLIG
jgi:hypothetical protein